MPSRSRLQRNSPTFHRDVSTVVSMAAFAAMLLCPVGGLAAESTPVLTVESNPSTVQVVAQMAKPLAEGTTVPAFGAWQLAEVGGADAKVAAQCVAGMAPDGTVAKELGRVVAAIPPREGAEGVRSFRLEPAQTPQPDEKTGFKFEESSDAAVKILDGQLPVLVYNHGLMTNEQIPQRNPGRSRACYIHPVWGIDGEVLTDDFPADHIHHHGIFWTWPHVTVGDVHHDLWLGNTLRDQFVAWLARESGPVAAVLAFENGWYVGEKKVMVERVWITVHQVADSARSIDLELTWIPVDQPITLRGAEEKGYGGLSMRFAPRAERDAVITVPSGRAREDLVMARLPWADFSSPMIGGPATPSGAAIMAHPEDPDLPPEWMARHYGAMCPGWPGTTAKTLEPGKPVRVAYRVWIHKATPEVDALEQAYAAYQAAAKAAWK